MRFYLLPAELPKNMKMNCWIFAPKNKEFQVQGPKSRKILNLKPKIDFWGVGVEGGVGVENFKGQKSKLRPHRFFKNLVARVMQILGGYGFPVNFKNFSKNRQHTQQSEFSKYFYSQINGF